jgi:hypothetical protein
VDSDLKSTFLGYSVVAKRHRDGAFIGWAHLQAGTRPNNGTVLNPGDSVGGCAGWDDYHGSSWTGPHIHTTEGSSAGHIYSGTNTDPVPDITAAKSGVAGGGGGVPVVKYDWYGLTKEAMLAVQQMLTVAGLYKLDEDGAFGPGSVTAFQEWFKRNAYLPGDYEVDGIPHNPDLEAPSNYGFAVQKFAQAEAGYDGKLDGLPAGYTSGFLVTAANKVKARLQAGGTTPPPIVTPPTPQIPLLPVVPSGFVFKPDLATTQGMFDFQEYYAQGGRWASLKFGGANASDSPYIAPAYKDQEIRARKAGLTGIDHYFFNGRKNNLTPEACADFMALHVSLKPGDTVSVDVEDETDTGTTAWTPAEVVRFIVQLRKHFPGICGLVYMSDSLADLQEWDAVVALGWGLWSASWGDNDGDPNTPPVTDDWPFFQGWQYTSEETVPGNYTVVNGVRTYGRTDGNMFLTNTHEKFGWKIPPVVDPEPEVPADEVQLLEEYFVAQAQLNSEYAAAIHKIINE